MWFGHDIVFVTKGVQNRDLELLSSAPGSKWRCASFWHRQALPNHDDFASLVNLSVLSIQMYFSEVNLPGLENVHEVCPMHLQCLIPSHVPHIRKMKRCILIPFGSHLTYYQICNLLEVLLNLFRQPYVRYSVYIIYIYIYIYIYITYII